MREQGVATCDIAKKNINSRNDLYATCTAVGLCPVHCLNIGIAFRYD